MEVRYSNGNINVNYLMRDALIICSNIAQREHEVFKINYCFNEKIIFGK